MFNWAKELLSPSVQTGKPVGNGGSTDSRRKSKSDPDGEVTEEGFVCVGKSSFYKSPEMPAISQNYNYMTSPQQSQQQTSPSGMPMPATLYPVLPPNPQQNQVKSFVGVDNGELVRTIPFTLRSGLSIGAGGGHRMKQMKPYEVYLTQFGSRMQDNRYNYEFNYERGVLRELNQQGTPRCY